MPKRSKKRKASDNGSSPKVAVKGRTISGAPLWFTRDWFWGLILVLAIIVAYQPVWWAGYIWDDDNHVTTNPCIIGPLGLKEIWTTDAARFFPMTLTTFWMEHALWGLAPFPYHLVNVFIHGACAVLLWKVLQSLQVPGAWLGAAIWALHPVEVESVAWITEMKNTQSGLFFLLSIFFFVKWLKAQGLGQRNGSDWSYPLMLLFAALAMASKSSTVILPLVLCLCAWWMQGRWQWRIVERVGPIFLMSVIVSALTVWAVKMEGIAGPQLNRTWPERLATVGDVVCFYLGKLVWPHPLIMVYPHWQIDASRGISYLPLLAVIIVLLVLWFNRETWSRPYFFALAYFLVVLLPVLGLVNHNFLWFSFVADHFQYLASMGPLALAGAGMSRLADFVLPGKPWMQGALGAGLLLILGILSWQRVWVYESEETLWTDTLSKNPNCWVGYNNLGDVHLQKGQVDEAMALFRKALGINPDYAVANNNFGIALAQKGQVDEALVHLQKAVEIDPNYAEAHNNLGNALAQKGRMDEAMAQYLKALDIDPNYAEAYNNIGFIFYQKGQMDEAIIQFQKALSLNPDNDNAQKNLALAKAKAGHGASDK